MYYPLFLNLSQARCLVVGGGEVGLRKVQGLLAADPQEILVLDVNTFSSAWDALRQYANVLLVKRPFEPQDINGRSLVFTCTGNRSVNAAVAHLCRQAGVLCNCADAPLEGNCIVPLTVKASDCDMMVALSTGGASPAWARTLKNELQDWLTPRVSMTILLGRLRPLVLALGQNTVQNTALFRAVAQSSLRDALAQGYKSQCEEILRKILPNALHSHIAELLHDIL